MKLNKCLAIAAVLLTSLVANATPTYVGSWEVYNNAAPQWSGSPPNGPLAYTAQEAAALLFGGVASDYVISTVGNNASLIDNQGWYDVIGYGGHIFAEDYDNKYLGQYYGPTNGYSGILGVSAASAFVRDNLSGGGYVNYAFRVTATVPDSGTTAGLLMVTMLGFVALRRKVAA